MIKAAAAKKEAADEVKKEHKKDVQAKKKQVMK